MSILDTPKDATFLRGHHSDCPFHSYLTALEHAYDKHYDIALSPDHIWFTLLCEVAALVKENPAKWEALFTTTPGVKQELLISDYNDPELIEVDKIVDMLKAVIPMETASFFPKFSTTYDLARMAHHIAFADIASPFYNYGMLLCRTPAVHVLGTVEDWSTLRDSIERVLDGIFEMSAWNEAVVYAIDAILAGEPIFGLERCGSGGRTAVTGEFVKLFRAKPRVGYITNYPTGLAQMVYKNHTTGRNFLLRTGLIKSGLHLPDKDATPILFPEFEWQLFETKNHE